jgi:hypothetical protein
MQCACEALVFAQIFSCHVMTQVWKATHDIGTMRATQEQ